MATQRWMPYLLGTICIVTAIHLSNKVRSQRSIDLSLTSAPRAYVHPAAIGVCADGLPYDARIEMFKGIPHLTRTDCTELPVGKHRAVAVTAESRERILYNGVPFKEGGNEPGP